MLRGIQWKHPTAGGVPVSRPDTPRGDRRGRDTPGRPSRNSPARARMRSHVEGVPGRPCRPCTAGALAGSAIGQAAKGSKASEGVSRFSLPRARVWDNG